MKTSGHINGAKKEISSYRKNSAIIGGISVPESIKARQSSENAEEGSCVRCCIM